MDYTLVNKRKLNEVKQKKIKGKNIHVIEFNDDDKIKITFRNNKSVLINASSNWDGESFMNISDVVKSEEWIDWNEY